jgi:hypothetical protein
VANAPGIYYVLDRARETDREQIRNRIEAMADALRARNLDALFANVSDQVRSPQGRNKQQLRELAQTSLGSGLVTELRVWDILVEDRPARAGLRRASFFVKAVGNLGRAGAFFVRCEATFEFNPRHGWQLLDFRLFDPARNNEEVPSPA